MLRTADCTRRSQATTLFPGSEPIPKGSKPRQRLAVPDAVRGFLARDDVVDVADGEPFDVDAPRPSLGEALDTIGRVLFDVKPMITATYPLERTMEAIQAVADRTTLAAIVTFS